jgi:hypothetical protein
MFFEVWRKQSLPQKTNARILEDQKEKQLQMII